MISNDHDTKIGSSKKENEGKSLQTNKRKAAKESKSEQAENRKASKAGSKT